LFFLMHGDELQFHDPKVCLRYHLVDLDKAFVLGILPRNVPCPPLYLGSDHRHPHDPVKVQGTDYEPANW